MKLLTKAKIFLAAAGIAGAALTANSLLTSYETKQINLEKNLEYAIENLTKQDKKKLTEKEIKKLIKQGVTIEYIKDLGDKFDYSEIQDLYRCRISSEYAKTLSDTFNFIDIISLNNRKVPVKYAKSLAKFGSSRIGDMYETNTPASYIISLENIKDDNGEQLFDQYDIYNILLRRLYHRTKDHKLPSLEYLISLTRLKDVTNKPVSKEDVISLAQENVPLKYFQQLSKQKDINGKLFTIFKICKFYQLKYKQFKDTLKPNAIVVYPTQDFNNAFETEDSINFFKTIRDSYDVKLVIADREEEVYKAIDSTPNTKLLILAGHGTKYSLSLGENDLMLFDSNKSEEYKIDLCDEEISIHLNKLSPDAVIFLYSCSNGEGGSEDYNLANFIIKKANGRKVIAAKEIFSTADVNIKSIYPFDIRIIDVFKNKDMTYTNEESSYLIKPLCVFAAVLPPVHPSP